MKPWKLGDWKRVGWEPDREPSASRVQIKELDKHSQTRKGGPGDELVVSLTCGH